jgi:methylenetetrahydrofolate dehydrogenase (NADP+) / methenyltetrahydrofolate cyclohydrolase
MAELIDGKKVAAEIREEIRREVAGLSKNGIQPGLVAVRVGDNPASALYVRNKRKACEAAGIYSEEHHLPADISIDHLLNLISEFNKNPKINGILVQLPLPGHLDADRVIQSLSPDKDVDGLHAYNIGRLTMGHPRFVPCTPAGVIELLLRYKIPIEGQRAVVVGRSNLVGRPAALLLMHRNATVTVCHSKTRDMAAVCRQADILIAAIGKPRFITGDMVKAGAAVIDVGINRLTDGSLVGDVDFPAAENKAGWITPVPGGVGPMTIAMLLKNTVEAAKGK